MTGICAISGRPRPGSMAQLGHSRRVRGPGSAGSQARQRGSTRKANSTLSCRTKVVNASGSSECKVSSHARAVAEAAGRQVGRPVAHPAEKIERARLLKATGDSLAVIYRKTGIPSLPTPLPRRHHYEQKTKGCPVTDSEDYCQFFVRIWAEAVLRQVDRVRAMRKRFHIDDRNYERLEEWSPTEEDLQRNFRSLWAEELTLLWAAHHLERWGVRLAQERGGTPPERDDVLGNVRNALEHLDDVAFEDDHAVPGDDEKKNWSLRKLPDRRLAISLGGDSAFGLIDVHELEARALTAVNAIIDELEQAAVDWYLEMASHD
jgi:hypothetical protein